MSTAACSQEGRPRSARSHAVQDANACFFDRTGCQALQASEDRESVFRRARSADSAKVNRPSDGVKSQFAWSEGVWLSFDVETHALAPPSGRRWEEGEFGHQRRVTDNDRVRALRVIQIAWAVGDFGADGLPVTKTRFVKPTGFEITPAAIAIHKITLEVAMGNGVGLQEALGEFISDLRVVVDNGGRVCGHNLEFDATIVSEEMARAKMDGDDVTIFESAIYNGFCTPPEPMGMWS